MGEQQQPAGIDDVAPADTNDGIDLVKKDDLAGVPLLLTAMRNIAKSPNGPWVKVYATRLDTGEQIAFGGATVLDRQVEECREAGHFPPVGVGVRAMLDLVTPEGGGNQYWRFVTPKDGATRIDSPRAAAPAAPTNGNGGSQPVVNTRVGQVKTLMGEANVTAERVRAFVDGLQQGASVDDLSDEHFATLVEFLKAEAVPF